MVNLSWHAQSRVNTEDKIRSIQLLANSLGKSLLGPYATQKASLLAIGSDTEIFNSRNKEFHQHPSKLKEKILNTLADLNGPDLDELSKQEIKPQSFEDIFVLAKQRKFARALQATKRMMEIQV